MRPLRHAFIFAAGEGTRLHPLTKFIAKPLLPFFGKPLLEIILDYLLKAGIKHIGININHLAPQFYDYFGIEYPPKVCVESMQPQETGGAIKVSRVTQTKYEKATLELFQEFYHIETAGGLLNAHEDSRQDAFLKKEPFLLHHGDILSVHDFYLRELHTFHEKHRPLMSLLLLPEEQVGQKGTVSYNPNTQEIVDFRDRRQTEEQLPLPPDSLKMIFGGIAIAEPQLISFIDHQDYFSPLSLIEPWLAALRSGEKILGFLPSERHYWNDIGTPEHYLNAHLETTPLERGLLGVDLFRNKDNMTSISPLAKLEKKVIVGREASLGPNVHLSDSLVLPGATFTLDQPLDRAIIFGNNQFIITS